MIAWMLYGIGIAVALGAAAAAVERVMVGGGRSIRWVWLGAVSGSVVLPFVLPWLRDDRVGAGGGRAGVAGEAMIGEMAVLSIAPAADGTLWVDRVLLAGWILATIVLLLYFLGSLLVLRIRRRGWSRQEVGGVPALVSSGTGPALVGFIWPELVVPAWILAWDPRSLKLLLAHEEEHITARDPLLLLFGIAAVMILPWNLPLWWQARRLRLATEMDCDARVLRRHPGAREYGMLLLDVGRAASSGRMAVAAFSEPSSLLERRVAVLMRRRRVGRRAAALLVSAALAGVAVACAIPGPDAPAADAILSPRIAGDIAEAELSAGGSVARAGDTIPELGRAPAFTPYDVRPEVRNRVEAAEVLARVYPPLLRDAGVGGSTTLWVFLDETGSVRNTVVEQSSGYEELDAAAEEAMREFRFSPAMNRGAAVPVWIQLPITFAVRAPRAEPAPIPRPAPAPPSEEPAPTAGELVPPPHAPPAAPQAPGFTPYDVRPKLRNRAEFAQLLAAAYPSMLKAARIEGTSLLWVYIDEDGRVGQVRLARSSGNEELDETAREVMFQATFTPAQNRGRAVGVWIQLPVTFQVGSES